MLEASKAGMDRLQRSDFFWAGPDFTFVSFSLLLGLNNTIMGISLVFFVLFSVYFVSLPVSDWIVGLGWVGWVFFSLSRTTVLPESHGRHHLPFFFMVLVGLPRWREQRPNHRPLKHNRPRPLGRVAVCPSVLFFLCCRVFFDRDVRVDFITAPSPAREGQCHLCWRAPR
ncbi:hypothetical protein QBC39DRAFT_98075 [Podospora conica]|nr:hypothetical protein QBC39DRAFT_98075 [Schizothecium conicum]